MASLQTISTEAPAPVAAKAGRELIYEVVVEASAEAINAALLARGIPVGNVVTIHYQPGLLMAIGDHTAKYRVLYRR